MSTAGLDEVDRDILEAVPEDARHNSNADISERVGVSASTVGKRIAALEERGVIRGYRPEIDYEEAGFAARPVRLHGADNRPGGAHPADARTERRRERREVMTGQNNVHIQVTGASNDDITKIARRTDVLGLSISDEILMRDSRPSVHIHGGDEE